MRLVGLHTTPIDKRGLRSIVPQIFEIPTLDFEFDMTVAEMALQLMIGTYLNNLTLYFIMTLSTTSINCYLNSLTVWQLTVYNTCHLNWQ